jgi:uncharacterized membrane-anchored protein
MRILEETGKPVFFSYGERNAMEISGRVRKGRRTKELAAHLKPKEIALIAHEDLDAMGALGLIEAQVAAVINACCSMTGRYPNQGPKLLWEAGVLHLDNVGEDIFHAVQDGDLVTVRDRQVLLGDRVIATGRILTEHAIREHMRSAALSLHDELGRFVENTLDYAHKEKDIILGRFAFPELNVSLAGRPVVVVVRGLGYEEDLEILSAYIQETQPVLLAVDGGADALLRFGHRPHVIVGDMDSVSDEALRCGAELVAHAYVSGECPGKKRLEGLGLAFHVVPAPGTSEDLALLLTHDKGAELIVLVGSHSNIIDFLEKGRKGMASTLLTRIKIGPILLDAKGVSKLYNTGTNSQLLPMVVAVAIFIVSFLAFATPWRHYLRLLWLQLRVLVGGT